MLRHRLLFFIVTVFVVSVVFVVFIVFVVFVVFVVFCFFVVVVVLRSGALKESAETKIKEIMSYCEENLLSYVFSQGCESIPILRY